MQFLTSLFGGDNLWLTALLALGIVIVLILFVGWGLKFVGGGAARPARGRNRRLMLVDSLPVDGKRQLLIVRRDNVEHLILTGGPADLVVETGIAVEESARGPRRAGGASEPEPQRRPVPRAANAPGPAPVAPPAAVPAANVSPLDRLRDLGKPLGQRRPAPRHPGLMRPVSQMERPVLTAIDNSAKAGPDSAKQSPYDIGGRAGFEDSSARTGHAAEQN